VVKRTGDGMETEYATIAKPHKALTKEQKEEWALIEPKLNMQALFTNDDPLKGKSEKDEFLDAISK